MSSSAPAAPWRCYSSPKFWPQSAGKFFMAKAVQLVGAARCEPWHDEAPMWMEHELLPEVPPVYEAFDETGAPLAKVHEAYAGVVRSVMSPATFAVGRLTEAEWIRSCVPNPDGGDPIPALLVRADTGADRNDPITRDHWEHVSLCSAQVREELQGAQARLNLVARTIQELAQEGRLRTFMRPIGGSVEQAEEIKRSWWELDDPLPRLAWCGLNVVAPLDPSASPTHWIFVDRTELAEALPNFEREEFFDPGPATPKAIGYSEQVIDDVASLLLEAFVSEGPEVKKEQFRRLVHEKRGCEESQTNWNAAWRRATAHHPERRRSGRPRTRTKSIE